MQINWNDYDGLEVSPVKTYPEANGSRSKEISVTEGRLEHGCFSCMIMSARRWTVAANAEAIATLPAPALEPVEG